MKTAGCSMLCVLIWLCAIVPGSAIGFDPRGAREADGLSREFDDATRLQQLQQAPQLEPPPPVEVRKPTPPPELTGTSSSDHSALVQASSAEQATSALQRAEQQMQEEKRGGFGHALLQFLMWSGVGTALAWAVWSWTVRRASQGINSR